LVLRLLQGRGKRQSAPPSFAFAGALSAYGLDKSLFDTITGQLKAKAIRVNADTLVDATVAASASKEEGEGCWVKHKDRPVVHGFKAHVGAGAETALVEEIAVTPANISDGKAGPQWRPVKVAAAS
jgi:IS5 family transposase